MVVGVLGALEEDRAYTYRDLSRRLGLSGSDLSRVIDDLVSRGRMAPVLCERANAPARLPVFEHDLSWKAVRHTP